MKHFAIFSLSFTMLQFFFFFPYLMMSTLYNNLACRTTTKNLSILQWENSEVKIFFSGNKEDCETQS